MNNETENIDIIFECPDAFEVVGWRKFTLKNFRYETEKGTDCIYIEVTYDLTKVYDKEGENSYAGVNYKYILYADGDLIDSSGCMHRYGLIRVGQTISQKLKICVDDICSKYRLVFLEY